MDKKLPFKWTIIIRTQGKRNETLHRALKSVAEQTYDSKFVLISFHNDDDEAFRKVKILLERFEKKHDLGIVLIRADSTKKRGHAINIALDNCKSKYVSILDDDDLYLPNMGEDLISVLDESNANLAYGNTIVVDHKENVNDDIILQKYKGYGEVYNPIRLVAENYIHFSGCIYVFSQFRDIRTNESIDMWEDWYLLLEMLFSNNLRAKYVNENVSEYHVIQNNTSNTFHKKDKKDIRKAYEVIENNFKEKRLSISYKDVFKVYPRQSLVFCRPNNSDIQRLRDELQTFRRIEERKSFQFFQKIFRW